MTSALDPPPSRELFDVPEDIAYFNVANLAPHLHSVARRRGRRSTGAAGRGRSSQTTGSPTSSGCGAVRPGHRRPTPTASRWSRATSYGFAVAARNLRIEPGERILVLAEEYPSGIYTWRRWPRATGAEMLTVPGRPGQSWTEAMLAASTNGSPIVSVPNVHWTDGALVDLDAVAARTPSSVPGSSSTRASRSGALPLDVAALDPTS